MSKHDFQKMSDKELGEEAQVGLRGQGAVVEMMGRLKETITNLNKTTALYSKIIIFLTIGIGILAVLQLIATIKSI